MALFSTMAKDLSDFDAWDAEIGAEADDAAEAFIAPQAGGGAAEMFGVPLAGAADGEPGDVGRARCRMLC